MSAPVGRKRIGSPALKRERIADFGVGDGEAETPCVLDLITLIELQPDGESRPVRVERQRKLGGLEPPLLPERIADLLVADRQVVLPFRIVGITVNQLLRDGAAFFVRRKRLGIFALPHQHVSEPRVADAETVQPAAVAGVGAYQILVDLAGPLSRCEGARRIADPYQRKGDVDERSRLALAQRRRRLPRLGELLLQSDSAIEDVLHQLDGNSHHKLKPLRQVVDHPVGGLRRRRQRLLGAVSLRHRLLLCAVGQNASRRCDDRKSEQHRGGRPCQPQRPALLLDLLREQVLFRHAADRGGEVGSKLGELGVALVGALAIGAEVDPFRLGGEAALERRR